MENEKVEQKALLSEVNGDDLNIPEKENSAGHVSHSIIEDLWNKDVLAHSYGTEQQYREHLFEQYKMFVEMADRISARRDLGNTFFLTLHTFLLGAIAFIYGKISAPWVIVFPLIAVQALCYVWWRLMKSYRQLNAAKYKVIGEYEQKLPTSPYWSAEWRLLGEGKNPELYKPLTDIENWVPLLVSIVYIVGAIIIVAFPSSSANTIIDSTILISPIITPTP